MRAHAYLHLAFVAVAVSAFSGMAHTDAFNRPFRRWQPPAMLAMDQPQPPPPPPPIKSGGGHRGDDEAGDENVGQLLAWCTRLIAQSSAAYRLISLVPLALFVLVRPFRRAVRTQKKRAAPHRAAQALRRPAF